MSCNFNVGKVHVLKNIFNDPSSLTVIKMLGLNIIKTKEVVQRAKVFVQTIIYNEN